MLLCSPDHPTRILWLFLIGQISLHYPSDTIKTLLLSHHEVVSPILHYVATSLYVSKFSLVLIFRVFFSLDSVVAEDSH